MFEVGLCEAPVVQKYDILFMTIICLNYLGPSISKVSHIYIYIYTYIYVYREGSLWGGRGQEVRFGV